MIIGIHHIGLSTPDPERSKAFYQQAFGLTLAAEGRISASGDLGRTMGVRDSALVTLIRAPNGYLEIIPTDLKVTTTERPVNEAGVRHFCVQNQVATPLVEGVVRAGGYLHAEPVDLGTGRDYAYARDVHGEVIEIESAPNAEESWPAWLGHAALVTHDIDFLLEFYTDLLEREVKSRGRFGPAPAFDAVSGLKGVKVEGAWIDVDNMLLEIWRYESPATQARSALPAFSEPGFNHICFETDDIELFARRATALGVNPLYFAESTSDQSGIFLGRDPDGNFLEGLEPRGVMETLSLMEMPHRDILRKADGR